MKLTAEPAVALVDEPTALAVEGARPGTTLRLWARTSDDKGNPWSSEASFTVADDGTVDPARTAPVAGSYAGVDAQGLLWSMRMDGHNVHDAFSKYSASPLTITFGVEAEDGSTTEASVHRQLAGPGVEQVEVDAPGVIATAYRPDGEGPFPPVLVISGTGGAVLEGIAALLASRGFATIAMAYFGHEGLPPTSAQIPIEYFRAGIDWLVGRPWAQAGKVGVYATSKGAEAAFLLGAHYDDVCAVVGYNPSGVAYEALSLTAAEGAPWTIAGQPVPYLPVATDFSGVSQGTLDNPYCSADSFLEVLADTGAVERASIAVESVGSILLVTGSQDRVWPARRQAELIVERMAKHGIADRVTHLAFEEAGHILAVPYLPTTGSVTTRGGPIRALGGTPEANAQAEAEGWAVVLRFLADSL